MKPRWFEPDKIPFDDMWSCDTKWISSVLEGEKIRAAVYFKDNNNFRKIDIKDLD